MDLLKIGSFNLYNLASPGVEYYPNKAYSKSNYYKKTAWIGKQLERMGSQIVGFQEVFQKEALQEALALSPSMRKATLIFERTSSHTPAVALATILPVISYEYIEEFPRKLDIDGIEIPLRAFKRPVLKAHLRLPNGEEATVFVAHLKSKRPYIPRDVKDRHDSVEKALGQARSLIVRAAESAALRSLLVEELKGRDHPVIMIGDVNDNNMAVTTRIISGDPPYRNMDMKIKKEIWDVLLYHVKDIQARQSYHDYYYSHIHNGHYEALDHIMVSEEFVTQNPDHIGKVAYVNVLNDHLVDQTLSEDRVEVWQSDHAQVVAAIELNEKLKNKN